MYTHVISINPTPKKTETGEKGGNGRVEGKRKKGERRGRT
jgi:hypothetical protein